ncbi:MAG: putative undecaprenyl-phosphate N-acetylglucosaminyl 1-phosphate transferase [bacterium ADurb.Bin400]|nr:MAG: putative undecaprenyl-phosphate N-acetylglucosaminyl 1-phosphate transferase [bacterium ADurb.Bin400]
MGMIYISAAILAFLLSCFLTGVVKRLALRYGYVAMPRKRDVHSKPVPRIGGIAFVVAFMIVSAVSFLVVRPEWTFDTVNWFGIDRKLLAIWVGGSIVAFTMLLDDLRQMSAWKKLMFQVMAATVVIASGISIDILSNPFGQAFSLREVSIPIFTLAGNTYHISLWSDLLTLIWLVGMMNIINFVDGVDGLASGVSMIAATTIFILSLSVSVNQPATALLSIILSGVAAGFLVWNFPPAKIFMGDSGSMFLGLMLGVLAIISGGKLATAFLVLAFPITDGILVAVGRLVRRENPFTTPDKTHLHHRFLNAGFTVRQSILILYLISITSGALALHFKTVNKIITAFFLVILLLVLIKVLNIMATKRGVQ